jgi:hypothetical protein
LLRRCETAAKPVENAVVGAAQANSENQDSREIKNNENKTKSGFHNLSCK